MGGILHPRDRLYYYSLLLLLLFFIMPTQAAHRYNEHKQPKYKTINYNLKSIFKNTKLK